MKKYGSAATLQPMSLANKYGISFKENVSLGGLGMNPNLNIEDEYIENLLKQVHFLNLQIKLIKEKQQNSDTNALWTLINRSNEPMMNNIVFSNKKYQTMRQETSKEINKLEHHISSLQNTQHSLLSELRLLENRKIILQESMKNKLDEEKERIGSIEKQIEEHKERYQSLLKDKNAEEKKNKQLMENLAVLENEKQKQEYTKNREMESIRHQEEIQEKILEEVLKKNQQAQSKIDSLKKLFETNKDYLKASVEQEQLKQKMSALEKSIIGANFQLLQLDESIKMAEGEKQKQIKERNNLVEKMQQNKFILFAILEMNSTRKDKQAENKKKQSYEIKKALQQKFKLQKNLEDVKKKLGKATETQNTIHSQVHNLELTLKTVKENHSCLGLDVSKLNHLNNEKETDWRNISCEVNGLKDNLLKSQREDAVLSREQLELSRELEYLKKKNEVLRERVLELGPIINNLRMDDLTKTVKKNEDFNRTVEAMMSKWTEIKDFGRV